ncbi:MAG: pimeloyl-ACP methyl ester carboxylesterase [Rhodothermales bacterium]
MRASAPAFVFVLALVVGGCGPARPQAGGIQLAASDGVAVFGDWHPASSAPLGTIVVFNQGGGDVRGEYGLIIPRLNAADFDVLAVDLRRGGDRFGTVNRTASGVGETEYSYCDAYLDVEAALTEARRFDDHPILWGSSFSAALAIQAAARRPTEVKAVLAFSPATGDPMDGCMPESFAQGLASPLLVLRAIHETKFPSVRAQLRAMTEMGHIVHVSDPGTHGSSTLDSTRVGASTQETWRVVETFLGGLPFG